MELTRPQRFQNHLVLGAALAGTAGALLVVLGAVPLPDLSGALEDATNTLGSWAYPAVAGFAFLETGAFVGLAVPGETAVVVGGVVAARGEVELVPLIGLVWLAAAAGDLASFLLGRRLGRRFLVRHGSGLRLGPERLEKVERFYERHGGKAVLVGRFAGLVRAVSPFLAGASGLTLRRFVPWSAAGALLWAATFTLVGYGFSESFAESGESAARIALGVALLAALAYAAISALRSSGLGRRRGTGEAQRGERAERTQEGADESTGNDVEREVDTQVDARERHRGGNGQRRRTEARGEDGHGGGRGEGRGAVPGGKRRVVGKRGERPEPRIGQGRARAVEGVLEGAHNERGGAAGDGRGQKGHRQSPPPHVRAKSQPHEQRPLNPRGREHDEHSRQPGVLEGRSGLDERTIEVEQGSHHRDRADASRAGRLLLVINGRASGIEDPHASARALVAVLEEQGAGAEAVVTASEQELWDALRHAAALGQRAVLVGGDGTLHAAANAPLGRLPELALVPSGRANNIARALGIPTSRVGALAVAASAPAQPVDALRVVTPERSLYALEAVSAGFHAEARAGYRADNSADLRQGLRALVGALRRFRPYRAVLHLPDKEMRSDSAAQLFLSNLPYFGFGFEVDPGADPADGRFEAILLEAHGRRRLLALLAAVRRGRHLGKRGVRRMPASRARLTEPLPLVADTVFLGTTTATVSVERARLRVASPRSGAAA